jgi:anthranilate/para-aminobenzoate synthase component I
VHADERRQTTAQAIASGRLPIPRWITVHPNSGYAGRCDGCVDAIEAGDYAFTVVLKDELTFHFHDECFDVYNRTKG